MMTDKNFPASSSDSSKPILQATTIKGDPGDDSLYAIASPSILAFPCDANGNNIDYTNNDVTVSIYSGATVLASGATANGWALSVISQSGCIVSLNDLIVSVSSISTDSASFIVRASKSGYSSLDVNIPLLKNKQGIQGIQGETGIGEQGSTGYTGIQGLAAAGYVVRRFLIDVNTPEYPDVSDNGSGNVRLTYDNAHGLEVGEVVHMYGSNGGDFDVEMTVTGVLNQYVADFDEAYLAQYDESHTKVFSARRFCRGDNDGYGPRYGNENVQELNFEGIFPLGAKPEFISVKKIDGGLANASSYWSAGYDPYSPSPNHYAYISNVLSNTGSGDLDPNMIRIDDSNINGYEPFYIYDDSDDRRNLYMSLRLYDIAANWSGFIANYTWEVYIAYKMFEETEDEEYPTEGQFSILDGETGVFNVGDTTEHVNIKVDICVERDSKKYSQTLDFVYNGTTLYLNKGAINPYISGSPTLNITFGKDTDGTSIQMSYVSTAGDGDAIVKYKISRI